MLFNASEFLLFFLVVTILFFVLPYKYRWLWLLIASCIFYMYFIPVYILIMAGTIIIKHAAGIQIEKAEDVFFIVHELTGIPTEIKQSIINIGTALIKHPADSYIIITCCLLIALLKLTQLRKAKYEWNKVLYQQPIILSSP